jgi:septum formation protein
MEKKIILATTSRYRIEAFRFLGIPFIARGRDVDEYDSNRPDTPEALVQYLSKRKAEAVASRYNGEEAIVLGFDSVACFDGQILEMPRSREEAYDRLTRMSGKTHEFYTGIYLISLPSNETDSRVIKTECTFRNLTSREIDHYLTSDPNYIKYALGYDSLGKYSASFIASVNGNLQNILRGMPLDVVVEMLKEANGELE